MLMNVLSTVCEKLTCGLVLVLGRPEPERNEILAFFGGDAEV